MQTPLSDVCSQGIFSNKSPSFIAVLLKSQQNNAIFFFFWCLPCPGSLIRFMRKETQHLLPPCSPTQPPTHFWAILHPAQTRAAHASLSHRKKKKKHNPCLSACIPLKSLTLTAVHIYTHMAASHKLQRWDNQILLSVVVGFFYIFFFFCSLCKTGE